MKYGPENSQSKLKYKKLKENLNPKFLSFYRWKPLIRMMKKQQNKNTEKSYSFLLPLIRGFQPEINSLPEQNPSISPALFRSPFLKIKFSFRDARGLQSNAEEIYKSPRRISLLVDRSSQTEGKNNKTTVLPSKIVDVFPNHNFTPPPTQPVHNSWISDPNWTSNN